MSFADTFPMTDWVVRRLVRRRALVLLGVVLALPITAYASLRIFLAYEAHCAGDMLAALNAIKIGDSEKSILPIVGSETRRYIVEVNPWYFGNLTGHQRRFQNAAQQIIGLMDIKSSFRPSLGLRFWQVAGEIQVSRGLVSSVEANLVVEGKDEWLGATWNLDREIPAHVRDNVTHPWPELDRYVVGWTHLHVGGGTGEGIRTWVTPAALDSELHAARFVNMSCLTSRRGCWALCNLMPDAARYHKLHPEASWGGIWGEPERTCE